MKFCGECGNQLQWEIPLGDLIERQVCPSCNHIYYDNLNVLVTCLATWQGKALWMRRAQDPAKGLWSVPGGYTEIGESLQAGAARELFEETQVKISPHELKLYGVGTIIHQNQVYVSFRADLPSNSFGISDEALEVALFSEEELPWDQLAYPELIPSVRNFYREMKSGNYGIYMGEYNPDNIYLENMINDLTA
jgi:ADP-ribose pyrophosphatase YjhB (NUDIX family)